MAGNDGRTKLRGKRWREKFGGKVKGGKINARTELRGKRWREENWRESRRRKKITGTGLDGKQKEAKKKSHALVDFAKAD